MSGGNYKSAIGYLLMFDIYFPTRIYAIRWSSEGLY